jgi:hypothetical protein
MEVKLNLTGEEYHMLMLMINHEENDNSYMLCRAKTEKRMEGMRPRLEQYAKDIQAFKDKAEAAYQETLRRCPAVNDMA